MINSNHWNALSSKFTFDPEDQNYYGASENVLFLWPPILKSLGELNNQTIIDFGCGTGAFCNHLKRNNANVIGVDSSLAMLAIAKQSNPDIHFLRDSDDAPDNADNIVSIHTFEFIKDITGLFSQIASKLKPNGQFIFAVHDADYLNNFEANGGNYIPSETQDDIYDFGEAQIPIFPRSENDYKTILRDSGFKNIDVQRPHYSEDFKSQNGKDPTIKNWAIIFTADT